MNNGLTGFALLIGMILAWTGSCQMAKHAERQETEAVARRAIERGFNVTPEQALELIQKQREWEGR